VLKVRRSHLLVAIAAVLFAAGLAVSIWAQGGAAPMVSAPPQAPRVALLDVAYIFANHTGFEARMDSLKLEAEETRNQMKKQSETIRNLRDRLQELKETRPGSPEYKQLEEQITSRQANLRIQLELLNKQFLEKEAQIYYAVYHAIQDEVKYYAAQRGIALVIRFNGEEIRQEEPEDVLRGVNSNVVWYSEALDITPDILRNLNLRAGTAKSNPSGTRPRPGVPDPGLRR
jgi:Skp family chaperone for outer membrane proteins